MQTRRHARTQRERERKSERHTHKSTHTHTTHNRAEQNTAQQNTIQQKKTEELALVQPACVWNVLVNKKCWLGCMARLTAPEPVVPPRLQKRIWLLHAVAIRASPPPTWWFFPARDCEKQRGQKMGFAGPKNPDTWSCSQTWLRQKTQQTISSGHAPVVDSLGGSQRDHLRPGCVSGARGKPLQRPGGGPVLQLRKRTSWSSTEAPKDRKGRRWAGLARKGCRRQNRRLLFCALFTARLRLCRLACANGSVQVALLKLALCQ